MFPVSRPLAQLSVVLLPLMLLAGCTSVFSREAAREVSRDKLLALADSGAGNHMHYVGSDRAYHYVYDRRDDRQKSYKVRAEQIELKNTFDVGEDSYVLWPWLIEGKLLGAKPK
jgi:hypothetical protein